MTSTVLPVDAERPRAWAPPSMQAKTIAARRERPRFKEKRVAAQARVNPWFPREPPPCSGKSAGAEPNRAKCVSALKCPGYTCRRADVAELVDAHGSGPCGGNPVEVQVLSSASLRRAGTSSG